MTVLTSFTDGSTLVIDNTDGKLVLTHSHAADTDQSSESRELSLGESVDIAFNIVKTATDGDLSYLRQVLIPWISQLSVQDSISHSEAVV